MHVQVKWRLEGVTSMDVPDGIDADSYIYDILRDEMAVSSYDVEYEVWDEQTRERVDFG